MGQQGLMTGCDAADWTTVFIMRVAITGCALSPNLPAVPTLIEPCRTRIFSTLECTRRHAHEAGRRLIYTRFSAKSNF
jgi:hypothetical protein